MANIRITELPALATLADTTVFSTVSAGTNYKLTGTVLKTYVRNSFSLATPATANLGGALSYAPTTGVFTFTPADKTNLVNGSKTLQLDTDGELSLPTNSYTEAVIKELSATALVLFAQTAGGNVKLLAGATSAGSAKQWLFNGTNGTLSSNMFLASAGGTGTTGYSFTGDGGFDTGMFSAGDGQVQFYSNNVKVAEIASGNLTISGHPTIEGVTSTGATGTGKLVFDNAPTFSGAVTVSNNTQSTSSTTGALIIAGGVGIARSLNFDCPVTTHTLLFKDFRDTFYAATFASTFTPDAANGAIQNVTLTGGITINAFANPVAGQTVTLILTQGGSGSYALTSTMKFAGGLKTLSTAVGSVDLLTITYTGSVYYASLVTGFA
jgi:autotransporter-associated beta strand protein